MEAKILPEDKIYYMFSERKCSRCRVAFREDEVPLHLWPKEDTNFMYSYCEDCTGEVIG